MKTMEIEFTDDQLEKIEILESKGIDVGQAIDLLFALQNEALNQIEDQKQKEGMIEKIKDTAIDADIKEGLLKKQYEESETYDKTLQTTKHKINWSKFFKL